MPGESPLPQEIVPASADESNGSPFDDGVLDAVERKRIRDLVSSAVGFLASRRLIPAVLMRVGPMRVLLPIVWGVGFMRSRRWFAGCAFLGIGLLSLAMALGPEIHFETVEGNDEPTPARVERRDIAAHEAEGDVNSFIRPRNSEKADLAATTEPADESTFRDPIYARSDVTTSSGRAIHPAGAVTANNHRSQCVWLLGTIEDAETGTASRQTADNRRVPTSLR